MQSILLAGIIAEGIILIALGYAGKLTRKMFSIIAAATIICSGVLLGIQSRNYGEDIAADQREKIYISARLLEEDQAQEALDALDVVIDGQCAQYQAQVLRGLALNLNEYYDTAALCLEDNAEEMAQTVYRASLQKVPVEDENKKEIVDTVKELLEVSDDEAQAWETKLKLLYFDLTAEDPAAEEKMSAVDRARIAVQDMRYHDAYQMMWQAAEKGGVREDIILSNMYVKSYDLRTMEEDDSEYDRLWRDATEAQVQLNRTGALWKEEQRNTEKQDNSEIEKVSDLEKEYEEVRAEYSLAQQEITNEAVRRAINYMEYSRPKDWEENIAYQFQLCRLYFMSKQEDEAKECLDRIFAVEKIDQTQWLGTDAHLLRENYILYLSEASRMEYRDLLVTMINHLYQGLFEDDSYDSFVDFVSEYLRSLVGGIVINEIDAGDYPKMSVSVSAVDENIKINKDSVTLIDTGQTIENFEITEKEVSDLTICFVLDRSGSMSGVSIADAKDAIQQCISVLDDFVKVGLVSFESDAVLECDVTNARAVLSNKLLNIETEGGTNIVAGLEQAYDALQNVGGRKVVILLSDGYDGNSDEKRLTNTLAQLKASGIEIYAIGLEGCDDAYLNRIAVETGGRFISVKDTGELGSIYQVIQQSLIKSYIITYENTDAEKDDRFFKIRCIDSFVQAQKVYLQEDSQDRQENDGWLYMDIQSADYFKQTGGSKEEY